MSAPTSRTETPPSSQASPGTPPSRRNSERRKRAFVRKNTQSAPDSFDNDEEDHDRKEGRPAVANVGYFNFDSMQRLLDLSIAAKPGKPSFLLTPGGKKKSLDIFTLGSTNRKSIVFVKIFCFRFLTFLCVLRNRLFLK